MYDSGRNEKVGSYTKTYMEPGGVDHSIQEARLADLW